MDTVTTAGNSPVRAVALLLLGALGFAVALAWNDLTKAIMKRFSIVEEEAKKRKDKANQQIKVAFIYAFIMTLILIGVGWLVVKKYPQIIKDL